MADDDMTASVSASRRGISIDALSERVHTQGEQITTLAADTKQQISGLRIEVGEKFSEVKTLVGSLGTEFRAATQQSAERGRVNWIGLVGTGVSSVAASWLIITGLLSLRLAPVEDKQLIATAALTQVVADLKTLTTTVQSNYLTRAELDGRRDDAKERRVIDEQAMKDLASTIKSDYATKQDVDHQADTALVRSVANKDAIAANSKRLDKLEGDVVSRREHEQRWSEYQKEIDTEAAQERRDSDEIKARLDQLYPASSFLKDLQDQQRTLQNTVLQLELKMGSLKGTN